MKITTRLANEVFVSEKEKEDVRRIRQREEKKKTRRRGGRGRKCTWKHV